MSVDEGIGHETGARVKQAYIVDDDDGFRDSLVMLLTSAGWRVEDFPSPSTFLARASDLDPGLLLLDLNMPGSNGLELLEAAIPELDRFAVVMITGAGAIHTAVRTIRAGAIDFIEKPVAAPELLDRLDDLDLTLAETLEAKRQALVARRRIETLSPRERDVLQRMLSGAPNKLIARALNISPRTVEMHRARMLQKLGVPTTAEALEIARRAKLEPAPRNSTDAEFPGHKEFPGHNT